MALEKVARKKFVLRKQISTDALTHAYTYR